MSKMGCILIVEDDRDARNLFAEVATLDGHDVVCCESAEDVDNRLGNKVPDLALLDIKLPREHGVSLAWRMRKRWPGLSIIVISAIVRQWDVDDLRDCGVDMALEKPCELDEMREAISRFM